MDREASKPRQLIVGVDAMEWDLVRRWAAEGKLVTFRRLMAEGMRAELSTPSAQLPDTVWAALYTSLNPGRIEKYYYLQYDPATMRVRHVTDDVIRHPPFWEMMSQAGHRVGIVDAPKFPASRPLNGFHLANWGAHATKTACASTPESLLHEINKRFGSHPVRECDSVDDDPRSLKRLRVRLLEGIRLRGEVFRYLLTAEPSDVFFGAFSESHCAGHHFWRFLDPTHPRYLGSNGHGLADTIEAVYRAIDREIGRMLAVASPDTRCYVVSVHGMGPLYHASWHLQEILDLLGYGRPGMPSRIQTARAARVNPWRILRMVLPGRLQYQIKALLPKALQEQLLVLWYTGGTRWEGCRAFAVPNNDSVGAIRLAVRGRDRVGRVAPGDEYRRVCEEIADALYELTDPVTGRPVVEQVTLTHDVFDGPCLDRLPDITVLWKQSFPWSAVRSPRFGTLELRRQDARSGSHTAHGFVVVAGPGVPAGVEIAGHSIYDIAPTILEAAGVPVPPDLDGRPLSIPSAAVLAR